MRRKTIFALYEFISVVMALPLAKQAKRITSLATLQQIRMGVKQARSIEEAEALMYTYLQKKSGDGQQN